MASSTLARRLGLTGNRGCKAPVRAASLANTVLSGEQTVGSVAVVSGDRVLIWVQNDSTQNGIYDVSTGPWTRSIDANGSQDWSPGTIGVITEGAYASQFWINVSAPNIVPDSSQMLFQVGIPALATLAASSGTSLIGFIQAGTGAVARTLQKKVREVVSVTDFLSAAQVTDARGGTASLDMTAGIQAAIDYIRTIQLLKLEGSTYTTVCVPRLYVPYGRYSVTGLTFYESIEIFGDRSVFVGSSATTDLITATSARWFKLRDLVFVSGKSWIRFGNANLDASRYVIDSCECHGGANFPLYSIASGGYTHLSCTIHVSNTKFMHTFGFMRNVCDYAIFEKCDLYPDKGNWVNGMAGFLNDTCDGNNRLYITDCTGVPTMGTYGVDRIIKPFWIAQKQGDVVLTRFRAGGEGGGMAINDYSAAPATISPYIGSSFIIDGGEMATGPQAAIESGILYLHGQVPQHLSFDNIRGPFLSPYINNRDALVNMATYFTNFQTASTQKDYDCFHMRIQNMQSQSPDFTVNRVPLELIKFMGTKSNSVKSAAAQVIAAGAATSITFDTVIFDNFGSWSSGASNKFFASNLASRMELSIAVNLAAGIAQGVVELRLQDSSGNLLATQSMKIDVAGTGAATVGLSLTHQVYTPTIPEWYEFKIYCTSVGGCTMIAGATRATVTQQNPVG